MAYIQLTLDENEASLLNDIFKWGLGTFILDYSDRRDLIRIQAQLTTERTKLAEALKKKVVLI